MGIVDKDRERVIKTKMLGGVLHLSFFKLIGRYLSIYWDLRM